MKKEYRYLIYSLVAILYIFVAYHSYGYDDELINIDLITNLKNEHAIAQHVIDRDVHPPTHYLINKWLFDIFGDWSILRTISAILVSFSGIYYIEKIRKEESSLIGDITLIIIVLLNPAYLLWGTSIRWYAYFLPILFILLAAKKTENSLKHWSLFAIAVTAMSYIGYAGIFLFPALFLINWVKDQSPFAKKIKFALVSILAIMVLYAYQFYILLNFQVKNSDDQVFSITKSIVGFASTQLSNQGVFPLSVAGILSILGFAILYSRDLLIGLKQKKINNGIISYIIGIVIFFVAGIAGKMRNFVVLSPLQNSLFHDPDEKKCRRLYLLALILIASANVWGMYNVTFHENTTKNSWNIPINSLLKNLEKEDKKTALILSHDPLIGNVLIEKGYKVYNPYENNSHKIYPDSIKKVIALKTFMGSIPKLHYDSLINSLDQIHDKNSKPIISKMSRDPYYKIKHKLEASYPEYQIEIIKFNNVKNLNNLQIWNDKIY